MMSVQIRSCFWSVFSRIRTEYGDLGSKSVFSVRIRENTDQKKLCIWTSFTKWKLLKINTAFVIQKLAQAKSHIELPSETQSNQHTILVYDNVHC